MTEFEKFLWQIAYRAVIAGGCMGIGFALGRGLGLIKEWIHKRGKKS